MFSAVVVAAVVVLVYLCGDYNECCLLLLPLMQ